MNEITWQDFENIDLRVWTIIEVSDFPEAKKPAFKLTIDFWAEIWIKKSSSQLKSLYKKEELIWKQIIWVVNFPKKQIWKFFSEVLVTWFVNGKDVILAVPDKKVENWFKLA